MAHLVNSNYVGSSAAYEAVDVVYKALPSITADEHLSGRLQDVLVICEDSFNFSHNASSSLRRLKIFCKVDRYRINNKRRSCRSYMYTVSQRVHTYQDRICSEFASLSRIAKRKDFELDVIFILDVICI
jgi:hypothetical protein